MTINFTPLITALESAPILNNELCRVFHGRGHSIEALSHLNLDFYPPSLFLVSYDEIGDNTLNQAMLVADRQEFAPINIDCSFLFPSNNPTRSSFLCRTECAAQYAALLPIYWH